MAKFFTQHLEKITVDQGIFNNRFIEGQEILAHLNVRATHELENRTDDLLPRTLTFSAKVKHVTQDNCLLVEVDGNTEIKIHHTNKVTFIKRWILATDRRQVEDVLARYPASTLFDLSRHGGPDFPIYHTENIIFIDWDAVRQHPIYFSVNGKHHPEKEA